MKLDQEPVIPGHYLLQALDSGRRVSCDLLGGVWLQKRGGKIYASEGGELACIDISVLMCFEWYEVKECKG